MKIASLLPIGFALVSFLALLTNAGAADAKGKPASDAQIEGLIEQLGDDDYFVRQWAQGELGRLKFEAFDALTKAENHNDLEVADRARYLLRMLRVDAVQDGDPAEVKSILESYDSADERKRLAMVDGLAKLPGDQGLAALCRLVRFDRSQVVSKSAALLVVSPPLGVETLALPARTAVITPALGRSPRVGAEWLRTFLNGADGNATAEAWHRFAETERQLAQHQPNQTRPEVIFGLLKLEALTWQRLGRAEQSRQAMQRMLDVESADSEVLGDLLTWLVDQKAWAIVDQAAEQFKDRFKQDPLLLYSLAAACEAQGKSDMAEKNAERALKLNEDNQPQHLIIAVQLQRRGLRKWAEAEYRKTIDIGPAGEGNTLQAQDYLAEMLHDAGSDAEAGKVLEQMITGLEERVRGGRPTDGVLSLLRNRRGQMHFFLACAAQAAADATEYRDQLIKGLGYDPMNADILIGLYRLPDADKELRERTMRKIREAAEDFRSQIQQSPDDSTPYNQLAWLIANTEGDFQEALHCSQKSLALRPNTAGYLDTLGRCYFALKDYENAVKVQTQATTLDPHSGLLRKQLEMFKKTAAAKPVKS